LLNNRYRVKKLGDIKVMSQHIMDFHTHGFSNELAPKVTKQLAEYYGLKVNGDGTLDNLIANGATCGVDYLLIFATATKAKQVISVNNWVASKITDRILGFGTLHIDFDDIENEIERIISLGLRGLKFHPDFQNFAINDPKMDRIFAAVEGRLPVLIHTGDVKSDLSHPRRIADILRRFPKLTVISAHLGGYSQWDAAREHLIGKNLYIDTSSALMLMPREKAVEIIRAHGTDKVLFGSDYPIMLPSEELKLFYSLGLTERENRDILFNNANRLLNIL
jgi:predicted TIM-barrel fold metal-dependent hydrolase